MRPRIARFLGRRCTSNEAEYWGLLDGLALVSELDAHDCVVTVCVWVCGDAAVAR